MIAVPYKVEQQNAMSEQQQQRAHCQILTKLFVIGRMFKYDGSDDGDILEGCLLD